MLELYHATNSVCAQKVRLALVEKELDAKYHLLTLRGDQHDPAYLKINPNGVVPTLVHDGHIVTESSIILYYLDEAFPEKPLMPASPLARAKVRLLNKLIDDYVHNACIVFTFAIAFRPALLKLPLAEREAHFAGSPIKGRAEFKRDVVARGLDSSFVGDALEAMLKLIKAVDAALKSGSYLAGDCYSNADAAAIPYILRLELLGLEKLWDKYPRVADWWARVRERPSTQSAVFAFMTEADWKRFQQPSSGLWPRVETLLGLA